MLQGDYVEKLYVKLLTVTAVKAVKCILPLPFGSPSYIGQLIITLPFHQLYMSYTALLCIRHTLYIIHKLPDNTSKVYLFIK